MKCNKLVDVGRRQFMRGDVIGAAGAAAATFIAPTQTCANIRKIADASPATAKISFKSREMAL